MKWVLIVSLLVGDVVAFKFANKPEPPSGVLYLMRLCPGSGFYYLIRYGT